MALKGGGGGGGNDAGCGSSVTCIHLSSFQLHQKVKSLIAENEGIQADSRGAQQAGNNSRSHTYVKLLDGDTQRGVHISRALIGTPNKKCLIR